MQMSHDVESVLFHFGRIGAVLAVDCAFGLTDHTVANKAGYPQKEDQCSGDQQDYSVMYS